MFSDACVAARGSLRLAAIASVIVALFAVGIRPDLYARAQRQLAAAHLIDWSEYDAFVAERVEARWGEIGEEVSIHREFEFRRGDAREPITDLLERTSDVYDTTYGVDATRLHSVDVVIHSGNDMAARWADVSEALRTDPLGVSPLELVRFIRSPDGQRDAELYFVDADRFERRAWREIGEAVFDRGRGVESVARVELARFDVTASVEPGLRAPARRWRTEAPRVHYRVRDEWNDQTREGTLAPAELGVEGTSVAAWLAARWPELGEVEAGALEPFAGLEEVWLSIADRSLAEAQLYLEAYAGAERRDVTVSIFGVAVPAPLVPVAGPLVIFALVAHFSRLVGHLNRVAPRHGDELEEFAWPVLHAGRSWMIDPLVGCVILPAAAQIAITAQLVEQQTSAVFFGWCVTLMSVVAGIVSIVWLRKLRFCRETCGERKGRDPDRDNPSTGRADRELIE